MSQNMIKNKISAGKVPKTENEDLDSTGPFVSFGKKFNDEILMEYINIDSPIKNYPGPMVDTTDRSLVHSAELNLYDPSGFRYSRPLEKQIFYHEPYVTCLNCNHISFVDIANIRRDITLPPNVSKDLKFSEEPLPVCGNCSKSDCFVVGSHDFTALIKTRLRKSEERKKLERSAAITIQRFYRYHLRIVYGRTIQDQKYADNVLKYRAVQRINATARGRLARRIAKTERALLIIKKTHPLVVRHCLKRIPGKPKVFWYKRKVELDLVFSNYLELIEKTGFQPPRKLVEENIFELSLRVLARQNELVVIAQKRWRGFMARRMVKYFRTELIRIFQFSVSRVIQVQKVYRGHRVRLLIPRMKQKMRHDMILNKYLKVGEDELLLKKERLFMDKTKVSYRKERQEEKFCRYTSKILEPKCFDLMKMKAFWGSEYSDNRLKMHSDELLLKSYERNLKEYNIVQEEINRKNFILQRIIEYGPIGFGWRSIPSSLYFIVPHGPGVVRDLNIEEIMRKSLKNPTENDVKPSKDETMNLLKQMKRQSSVNMTRALLDQKDPSIINEIDILQMMTGTFVVDKHTPLVYVQLNETVRDAMVTIEENHGPKADYSKRSIAMRKYFEKELIELAANLIERIRKSFDNRHLHKQFKEYNEPRFGKKLLMGVGSVEEMKKKEEDIEKNKSVLTITKKPKDLVKKPVRASIFRTSGYKYPKNINFDGIDWLYQEHDKYSL